MKSSGVKMRIRGLNLVLRGLAATVLLVVALLVGVSLFWWFPPKPVYTLTVLNQGHLGIVGGYLSGDSIWRPVGPVVSGRATAFDFEGCSGRERDNYRLHLVRSDSSRVTVEIGWITGDWDASSLSHDAVIIPSDSAVVCSLVHPMVSQNELMRLLRQKQLIDRP